MTKAWIIPVSFAALLAAPLRAETPAAAPAASAAPKAEAQAAAEAPSQDAPAVKKAAAPAAKKKTAAPKAKAAAPAKKTQAPAASAAPKAEAKPAAQASSQKAPAGSTAPVTEAADQSLDVTITGETRDEIPLTLDPPSADVPFEQIASLSREGQTDRVLSGPVEHMTGEEQMRLLRMESNQAYLGMPARIPSAPFLRMEVAPGLTAVHWEMDVLDQDDASMMAQEGNALPKHLVEWDGFQEGQFKLRTGPAYTPVLALTDEVKRIHRYYGEPVHFAALQYLQDGVLHIEFDNNRLFERGRSSVAEDMKPYLLASLNVLRQHLGRSIRVVHYAKPGASPQAPKRLDNLRAFFKEGLALEDDMISFAVEPLKNRGDITEILAGDKP